MLPRMRDVVHDERGALRGVFGVALTGSRVESTIPPRQRFARRCRRRRSFWQCCTAYSSLCECPASTDATARCSPVGLDRVSRRDDISFSGEQALGKRLGGRIPQRPGHRLQVSLWAGRDVCVSCEQS